MSSEKFSLKDGMATHVVDTARFRSVVKTFEGKRGSGKITITQSPVWQNWEPIGKVAPATLEDTPVFLVKGPGDYWLFNL